MRTDACLECLAETRRRVGVPLIPMTYASLFETRGWERLAGEMRDAGATSMIVVDLPAGDRPELRRVQLVAPPRPTSGSRSPPSTRTAGCTSSPSPARRARARALAASSRRSCGAARAVTDVPLYAGFGISTPEDARAAAELADGVVVGTAAVAAAEEGRDELDGAGAVAAPRAHGRLTRSRPSK